MTTSKHSQAEVIEFVSAAMEDEALNAKIESVAIPETDSQKRHRILATQCGWWLHLALLDHGKTMLEAMRVGFLFAKHAVVNDPVALAVHYADQIDKYDEIRDPSLLVHLN